MLKTNEEIKAEFSEYLVIVLTKMCEFVGVDYEDIDFSNEKWYTLHKWTIEECERFKKWLSDLLYNNVKARNELMQVSIKRRKICNDFARYFAFQYGWSYLDNF